VRHVRVLELKVEDRGVRDNSSLASRFGDRDIALYLNVHD
jgi:hypothetical protein